MRPLHGRFSRILARRYAWNPLVMYCKRLPLMQTASTVVVCNNETTKSISFRNSKFYSQIERARSRIVSYHFRLVCNRQKGQPRTDMVCGHPPKTFELKIGTPVTHTLLNVHINSGFSMLLYFRFNKPYGTKQANS